MTRKEAIDKYVDKFGGWPYFDDEYIRRVCGAAGGKALEIGKEIKPVEGRVY